VNLVEYAGTAFHLYGFSAAFLNEPASVLNRVRLGDVVGHERHVSHQQCRLHTAPDATGMENHFVHGYGQSVLMTHRHHTRRVAHQNDVDA
jgi:hypothetical protein